MRSKNTYLQNQSQQEQKHNQNQMNYYTTQNQSFYSQLRFQIFNMKNLILNQLLVNKNLIDNYYYLAQQDHQKISTSDTSTNSKTVQPKRNFQFQGELHDQILNSHQQIRKQIKCKPTKQNFAQNDHENESQSSSYYPSSIQAKNKSLHRKSTQTKNILKNFGSSIIHFVKKYEQLVKRLLEKENIQLSVFKKVLKHYHQKLNNMAQFRSFWSDEQNECSKVCRILSMIYLRKHSLEHIFNSRIKKYSRHIKYRYKIIQGVKNPSNFSQMKEF